MPRMHHKKALSILGNIWFLMLLMANPAQAAISDLLIAIETDGRSHTVQHTIGSNGASITLALPGSVIPQQVRFIGSNQRKQLAQYKTNPRQIQLDSGSAFARYHHQYGVEVEQTAEGEYKLTTISRPNNVTVEFGSLEESSITWVFPSDFEVTSYTVADSSSGTWVAENNMLTFHQQSDTPVTLGIRYRVKRSAQQQAVVDACPESSTVDACAPDNDADGVPDYRDLCLDSPAGKTSKLGCKAEGKLVLSAIKFSKGNSYLDTTARELLDRVAFAIKKQPDASFEIGSHTDDQGDADFNQQLSYKRAQAVRHYLLIKGVDPNSVRATGFGEAFPLTDNTVTQGRQANRRIEFSQIE